MPTSNHCTLPCMYLTFSCFLFQRPPSQSLTFGPQEDTQSSRSGDTPITPSQSNATSNSSHNADNISESGKPMLPILSLLSMLQLVMLPLPQGHSVGNLTNRSPFYHQYINLTHPWGSHLLLFMSNSNIEVISRFYWYPTQTHIQHCVYTLFLINISLKNPWSWSVC